jgi:hypothetical protein
MKKYHWQSNTMGNLVPNLWEVIAQIFESWFVYHTLDLKWTYSRNGF